MKVLNLIPMKNVHMMKAAALILAAGLKTVPPAARGRRGERSGTGWSRCVFDGRELSDSYGSDSFFVYFGWEEMSRAYSGKELLA